MPLAPLPRAPDALPRRCAENAPGARAIHDPSSIARVLDAMVLSLELSECSRLAPPRSGSADLPTNQFSVTTCTAPSSCTRTGSEVLVPFVATSCNRRLPSAVT